MNWAGGCTSIAGALALLAACGGQTNHQSGDDLASGGSTAQSSTGGHSTQGDDGGVANAASGVAGLGEGASAGTSDCAFHPSLLPGPLPDTPAQNISGEYTLVTCGQEQQCVVAGNTKPPEALSPTIGLSIQQAKTLELGSVTLHGTGEPLLDERTFDAVFSGRRLAVEVHGPLSDACPQKYSLTFHYDFDGVGPRGLALDFERLNTCSGNAGPTCEGSVRSDFGAAQPVVDR